MPVVLYGIKTMLMCMYMSFSNMKILNLKIKKQINILLVVYVILSIMHIYISEKMNININTTVYTLVSVSMAYALVYKLKITYSIVVSSISMAINQIFLCISSIIMYMILGMLKVYGEYENFIAINILQIGFLIAFWRIKRIRNGITFLKKWKDDEYMNLLLLNISSAILFIAVILSNYQEGITSKFGVMLIIFAIVMFITIWKSLQLYYKQQMLEKVLE